MRAAAESRIVAQVPAVLQEVGGAVVHSGAGHGFHVPHRGASPHAAGDLQHSGTGINADFSAVH